MRDTVARIESAVARFASEQALWPAGATLVAAVSGGADSLCLLGALLALRDGRHPLAPSRLVVAHLDHGLRGEAGAADAHWVAGFAAARGLECVVERTDVRALARAEHRGIEDAARRARYVFLRRVALEAGAARVCTGHTRDDQSETLVLHWLRGSGLAGLAGMAPLNGDLARPLLDIPHADTVAYCAGRGWQPREDLTNTDRRYLRNRVRSELLPALETYNPNLRETLLRNAILLASDNQYLEELTETAWRATVTDAAPDCLTFALPALAALPTALCRRVLRRAGASLLPEGHGLEARHTLAIERLVTSGASGDSLALPGGLRVRREYAALLFERRLSDESALPYSQGAVAGAAVPLPIPGTLDLPALGWRLRVSVLSGPLDASTLQAPSPPLRDAATGVYLPSSCVYLDADLAVGERDALLVRTWRPGDRLQPLGMHGIKKVQDLFTDLKIPRPLRTRLPLVFGADFPLWIAGLRGDERSRVTTATTRVLVLELEPLVS